jgi:hypothetical protein
MKKVQILIEHQNYTWQIEALSFEHGINLAKSLHERLGLIGRTYISSSCGKQTWIR